MDKDKVLALAKLARIRLANGEAESLSKEFDSILNYVGEIKNFSTDDRRPTTDDHPVRNVMREDGEPHEAGVYTEKILAQAPEREGNYIKVKKIL